MTPGIADLYGEPLDRFVHARDELAKRLKADGKVTAAAEVKGMRKPSVALWAVHQAARADVEGLTGLRDAGAALRRAQQRMMSGVASRDDLREATGHERAAVERMVAAASAALTRAGQAVTATTIERITDTFQAAGRDDEAGALLAEGVLDRELDPAGFGDAPLLTAVPATPRPSAPDPAAQARARELKAAKQAVESARETLEGWEAAVRDAATKLADAETGRDRAAVALEAAEARVADLEG